MIVGCVYRHPSMFVDEFNKHFLTPLLEKATQENKPILLLGDFNIDLLQVKSNKDVSEYFDLTSQFNLLPHIILPTRVTETTSTVIDNIFFSSAECDTLSGNIISSISDHFPQFLVLKDLTVVKPTNNVSFARDWKNFDHAAFLVEIRSIDWETALKFEDNDPNISFDNLVTNIN